MKDNLAEQKKIGTVSFKELFSARVYLRPMVIMLFIMFFQQFSGINNILFNLTDVFDAADTGLGAGMQATIVALVQVLATGVAVVLVDRLGRKILLIASAALMTVSIIALGVYFNLEENICLESENDGCVTQDTLDSISWLPLVSNRRIVIVTS